MDFSNLKRIGFLVLLGLLVLFLAAGFIFQGDLLNFPFNPKPADGEPPELEPLNQPSPDGKTIVGVSADDSGMGGSQITLSHKGAKDFQVIATGDEGSWVTNPIWSPDGKTVAYLRVIDVDAGLYEIDSRFELWVYDVASGTQRLVTDSDALNPAISFDGTADILWVSDTQIKYPDNSVFPTAYYTVDIHTIETTIDAGLATGGVPEAASVPGVVPYFSQCDSAWGNDILGTCSQYNICEQGCAISSVAMVFKYFGISTNPGSINQWLKANGGYAAGCLINWSTAANLSPAKLTFVARVTTQDWARLRYEISSGYPVILEVPFPNGQHFVVATGYSGDTVFINDPYYPSRTTLDSYGNRFLGLRIYHGPTGEPASCPAPTDSRVYVCEPALTPEYKDNTCNSLWYPIMGYNGNYNYLVENAQTTATSTNSGSWTPELPSAGLYKVDAYISAHGTFSRVCSWGSMTFGADSSKAKYVVTGKGGEVTEVVSDQLPMNNEWMNLGEFYFDAGTGGSVSLSDVTGELESSRNLSFGAMRFTLVGPAEYPKPTVNMLTPSVKPVGAKAFTLTLSGSGFDPASVVRWNGVDRSTIYESETVLKASISAADLASAGMAAVTVLNPAPGGGESAAIVFPVISFNPWKGDQLTTAKVTLDWDDIAGAVEYKVQLSKTKDFSTLVNKGKTTDSVYFYDTLLNFGDTYYWRIKYLIGDSWSEWSPVWKFTAMDALSAPLLIAPDHKLTVNQSSVTLAWQPVLNAANYRVVVARDSNFILKVKRETIESSEVNFTLPDGKYFWRVRAIEPFGTKSPWSEVRILKVYTVQ
ncbi:MAG: C39 family peptidase [Anaerolineaceae bacterium]